MITISNASKVFTAKNDRILFTRLLVPPAEVLLEEGVQPA